MCRPHTEYIGRSIDHNYAARVVSSVAIALGIWGSVISASLGLGTAMSTGSTLVVRTRVWLGLSLILATGAALSLVPPGSAVYVFRALVAALAMMGLGLVIANVKRGGKPASDLIVLTVTVVVVAVIAAWMAIGEVRNYDTGLYHLQLIALTTLEGVAPGLAQLHDRFGFTSSLWPLGSQLELVSDPNLGFRLVAGLFLIAFVLELLLRLLSRDRCSAVGTWIITVGSVGLVAYGISYAGRTFAGIGQDWIVAALWLVATAYLADWLQNRRQVDLAAAVIVATLAGSVRPFAWLLLAGVLGTAVIYRRSEIRSVAATWWAGILTGIWILVTLIRDALASGWLLFPLSLFPLPVPWRSDDPGATADAITLWARAPFNMDLAASSWDWFPGWATRIFTDWIVVWLLVALALALVVLVIRWRSGSATLLGAPLGFVPLTAIQVVALGSWFYAAPDPRFAWGPLLAIGGLAVAAAAGPELRLSIARHGRWLVWVPLGLVVASVAFAVIRDPGWWIERGYAGSPVTVVPLPEVDVEMVDGVARTVGPDDRCWRTVVPCVPWYSR